MSHVIIVQILMESYNNQLTTNNGIKAYVNLHMNNKYIAFRFRLYNQVLIILVLSCNIDKQSDIP